MLSAESVPRYIAERAALADRVDPRSLTVTEVGDGNLNLVFICSDASGSGIVLKQALPYVRLVGPDWPMTEARADREATAIRAHSAVSEDVCQLLDFDADAHVLALEDLSDHEVFRTRLNNAGPFHGVTERVGRYVAEVAFGTSFLTLGEEEFRRRAAATVNPDMCAITEDLIVTEPYLGADRNSVRRSIEPLVRRMQADEGWVTAAMIMKRRFLTCQEALVHGDLHTGSIFVRGDGDRLSVKTFDSEFAFYGPVGFDLGLLWANMLAASARAAALGDRPRAADLRDTVASSWHAFVGRFDELWPTRHSASKYPDTFRSSWLAQIRADALGFAGCEAARRVIGLAKVSDLETLNDDEYATAAAHALEYSRRLLVERETLSFDALTTVAAHPG
jgi:5-methylthioribose kinase